MKNKTPIQDMIDWLEEVEAPSGIIKQAKSLLEKEKEMIIKTYLDSQNQMLMILEPNGVESINTEEGELYYKSNFEQINN